MDAERRRGTALKVTALVVVVVVMVLATIAIAAGVALGGCDSFGGRCEPGDTTGAAGATIAFVIGIAATVAVAVAGATWIRRHGHRPADPRGPLP